MIVDRQQTTHISWPGEKPPDRVQVPQDPALLRILEKYDCTVKLAENCFDLVNARGDAIAIDYGATLDDWEEAARFLSACE